MLFFAVTLGFFAENIREHYIEKEREIKYLQNVHQDLEKDIEEVDSTIISIDRKQMMADSIKMLISTNTLLQNLPDFYYFNKSLGFRHLFENSTNGFTQLKTAGGLRLIANTEIINKIQTYSNTIGRVLSLQDLNESMLLNYRLKSAKIINVLTSIEMDSEQNLKNTNLLYRYIRPAHPRPLLSTKPEDINEAFNIGMNIVNTNRYIKQRLITIRKQAIELDELILKEYGTHFK